MNNPDHISENLETIFGLKYLKFFDADPGSGMEKIRIRDKHSGSAILLHTLVELHVFVECVSYNSKCCWE